MHQVEQVNHEFTASSLVSQQSAGDFILANASASKRAELEQFVQSGFASVYDARVSEFMPYLLAVEAPELKAVLGLRSAAQPLFIEQYLDCPIEDYFDKQLPISRNEILEIGHLVSHSREHTTRLFMVTAISAIDSGFCFLVFSATDTVAKLLSGYGLALHHLKKVDGGRLGDKQRSWGSYYQTAPQVMALKLSYVTKLCEQNPLMGRMKEQLSRHSFEL
jgi:hypothetical protein